MRKSLITVFIMIVIVGILRPALAQNLSSELSALAEKLERSIGQDMAEWKHERGEPVAKDSDVLIEYWRAPRRMVRIVVVPHRSAAEAKEALQGFAREKNAVKLSQGHGDESYSWGIDTSEVAFRKGRLTIYVSVAADTDRDPESKGLAPADRAKRRDTEQQRLRGEFAKHVTDSIDLP
jgi:hypothetical protein